MQQLPGGAQDRVGALFVIVCPHRLQQLAAVAAAGAAACCARQACRLPQASGQGGQHPAVGAVWHPIPHQHQLHSGLSARGGALGWLHHRQLHIAQLASAAGFIVRFDAAGGSSLLHQLNSLIDGRVVHAAGVGWQREEAEA
jgi:hypothetical protein